MKALTVKQYTELSAKREFLTPFSILNPFYHEKCEKCNRPGHEHRVFKNQTLCPIDIVTTEETSTGFLSILDIAENFAVKNEIITENNKRKALFARCKEIRQRGYEGIIIDEKHLEHKEIEKQIAELLKLLNLKIKIPEHGSIEIKVQNKSPVSVTVIAHKGKPEKIKLT